MVRIIVKSGYMKGKSHKEYYVNYIATREGVEKFKSDYGNMKATKKQQKLIQQLIKDYPTATGMFEYNDFKENPTRENASEFISSVLMLILMILQQRKTILIIFHIVLE